MARRRTDDADDVPTNYDAESAKNVNDQRVKDRIKEYQQDFEEDSLTSIDRLQISQMAKLELAASDATDALINPDLSPNQRKALSDSAKALIAEARQLADSLGMTRKRRVSGEGAEFDSYIPRLFREAQEFMHSRAIAIVCPLCLSRKERRRIHMGSIIYPFAFETEWKWISKCPKCNEVFEINESNYADFTFARVNQDFEEERIDEYAADGTAIEDDE